MRENFGWMAIVILMLMLIMFLHGCSRLMTYTKPRTMDCMARCEKCEVCELKCSGESETQDSEGHTINSPTGLLLGK